MYYTIFFSTFFLSSLGCFIYDFNFPEKRYLPVTRDKIIEDYKKIFPLSCLNLMISKIIFDYTELNLLNEELFNPKISLLKLILWLILSDLLFYSLHYLFHHPYLYAYFHSYHHEYNYTYGLGALYGHPIDYFVTNLIPLILPIIVLQIHKYLIVFLILFSTLYTVIVSHGGYNELPRSHLLHHTRRNVNYGLFYTDVMFNTHRR